MSKEWIMPVPFKGQIVLWHSSGVRNVDQACPALVKEVAYGSLHVKVFGIGREFDQTCVRHVDDPEAKESDRLSEGGWFFCGLQKTGEEADAERIKANEAKLAKDAKVLQK